MTSLMGTWAPPYAPILRREARCARRGRFTNLVEPRWGLRVMLKFRLPVLFIFIVLLAFLTRIEAKEQTVTLRGEVAAGDAYTGRLRNLPKGASLSIDATVSGEIRILLLDPEDARRWPAVEQPLFEGNTSDRMRFALQVPRSGHYFIILDNRDGGAARTFTLRIQGSTDRKSVV